MTQTLEDWNARYASMDDELSKKSSIGYDFAMKTNYKCRIKNAAVKASNRGDIQLELDLEILDGDTDDVVTTHREWIALPKQKSDTTLANDMVLKITKLRRDALGAILAAAIPDQFSPYQHYSEDDGKRTFYGKDDRELSRDELDINTVACNRAVLAASDELHGKEGETLEELAGTELYLVKSANKKNPDYPYTSFHRDPVLKFPVFASEG